MTQSKPVKKSKKHPTNEEIQQRQSKLKDILYEASQDGKYLPDKVVLEKLAEAKFKITRSELARDKRAIATNNSWLRDLAEHNYSSYMEESFELFKVIRNEAMQLAGSDWVKRTVKDKTTDEGGSHEVINTTDEAGPKKMFYDLALNAENSRVNMLKGDVLNYTMAFLGKKLQYYKEKAEAKSKGGVLKLK